ncbi:hypothetical protein SSP24_60740 [Streptomyces spinoverrucosus]|uniref:Uncharacterized protein n=1 Tax=Streptomyces spinoverrucosus TaxID=284043 RepID=A0A4Y3VRW9_9ACTN|nr:hypothetical protein [Streptomyces spinoverrucosus]GEC08419.1 hypothetical protein SSP24_60740 [Streptomyces spinoverrucosus]GHB94759.1 hypothetical protein GCM10010397_79400 [Streptomyces spinoverrucosus]
MHVSLVPGRQHPRLPLVETVVTLFVALCWKVLAFAMYAEGYDLDPSAPVQMSGDEQIEDLALLFAASVPLTWLLRLVPWSPVRTATDALVALRLVAVLLLSAVMFLALLTGMRVPLLGWRI